MRSSPDAVAAPLPGGALGGRVRRNWRREVVAFAAVYMLYSLARGFSTGEFDTAVDNAQWIIGVQAELGLNVEHGVQQLVLGLPGISILNGLYLAAQLAVVPVGLIVVFRRRPDVYPLLRTTVIAAWAIAIPLYALFPTAPPRLAGIGILDTVSTQTPFALDSPAITAFYNPVAAVPSLHASFAFAIGVAVATTTRNPLLKGVCYLWGPLVVLVVIATGNHFVLDIAMGLLVTGVACSIAFALHASPFQRSPRLWSMVAGWVAPLPRERRPRRRGRAPWAWSASFVELDTAMAPAPPAPDLTGLRVALICPYAWDVHGGVRSHVEGLAAALERRGLDVDILAPVDDEAGHPEIVPLGPTVTVRANGSTAHIAIGPGAAARTLQLLAAGEYDLVHVHEPLLPAACLAAVLRARVPVVGTFHMYASESGAYRRSGPWCRIAADRLHGRIAVSEPARACAARYCPGEYRVIPNGIELPEAGARTPREGPPPPAGHAKLLFVGRPDERKGLPVLLRAFARLPERLTLDLVGVEPADLKRLAPGTGVDLERVRAHGRVSEAERARLLGAADVLVAPSLTGESFGLVLVEGMAAGVPVVASAIAGYAEVLPPACGRLVPPGDPDALAAALVELAADAGLRARMGAAGRRAAERYAWPRVVDEVLDAYRAVLTPDRAPARQ